METTEKDVFLVVHGLDGYPVHSVLDMQLRRFLVKKGVSFHIKSHNTEFGITTVFHFESDYELASSIVLKYPTLFSTKKDSKEFFKTDNTDFIDEISNISAGRISLFDV